MTQWKNWDNVAIHLNISKAESLFIFLLILYVTSCVESAAILKSLELACTVLYSARGTNTCLRKRKQMENKHRN